MKTHALVVMVDESANLVEGGRGVFLFDSESDADDFAAQLLIEKGEVVGSGGTYGHRYGSTKYDSLKEAVEAWVDGLGIVEYFHVFPVMEAAAVK